MSDQEKKVPLASTYQQVLENMEALANLGNLSNLPMDLEEIANTVKKLEETIVNPPEGGASSDVITTEDGSKVLGNHLNTGNAEDDTPLDSYTRGVTFEIKNVSVVGLSGKDGMTDDYCMVMTVKRDSAIENEPEELNFTPFQMAFSSSGACLYIRHQGEAGWGEWKGLSGNGGSNEIISESQPDNQKAGDYWCQPIVADEGE